MKYGKVKIKHKILRSNDGGLTLLVDPEKRQKHTIPHKIRLTLFVDPGKR